MNKTPIASALLLSALLAASCTQQPRVEQPTLGTRSVNLLEQDGYRFKDLNKNDTLDPYEDWRLDDATRIADLVSRMTLEEKVGLMFHPNIAVPADGRMVYDAQEALSQEAYAGPIGPGGGGGGAMAQGQMKAGADVKTFIVERHFRCILNNGIAAPREFATWSNAVQEVAEQSRLGIPVVFSSDPRHGAVLGAHVSGRQYFSGWPSKEGQVGITASRDRELVVRFGQAVAQEYRAVGLHMILGPQIDVMTEPRWSRNMGAFSEDANLTADMLEAFMEGAQGESVGPEKVLVHLKHWPGVGPHEDGHGDFTVYPGDCLEYHLRPWKRGIEHGALAVMGYYSGTYVDTLNVCYSPYWSTRVLYDELGFRGAICTDWGVVSRTGPLHPALQGRTSLKDNMAMVVNAGVDQMGSETEAQLLVELVQEGRVTPERIDLAASRILQWHFALGLFENPYVDPEAAERICRSEQLLADAYRAQLESVILLTNADGTLPAREGMKLYVEGIDAAKAATYAEVVSTPEEADLILVRTQPSQAKDLFGDAEKDFKGLTEAQRQQKMAAIMDAMKQQEVDIAVPEAIWAPIRRLSATGRPVVVAFNPTGSSVVLPEDLETVASGCLLVFDVDDTALLDVVFGRFKPCGKLPFEIPATMDDVRQQLEDVPFDAPHKAFAFGHGLSY